MLAFEAGIAERELMRAMNHIDVFGYRVIRRNEASLNGSTHSDRWTAGDGHDGLMRNIAVDLHADIASREIIVVEPLDGHAIECDAKRVYRICIHKVRVADRRDLSQIIQTTRCAIQQIL